MRIHTEDLYAKGPGLYGRFADKKVFLYELLELREPHQNISHKQMPLFGDHCMYINRRPHIRWEVVTVDDEYAGYIYLSRKYEIGMHFKPGYTGMGIGSYTLNKFLKDKSHRPLYANINRNNTQSIKFFVKHGFVHDRDEPTQSVYRLD